MKNIEEQMSFYAAYHQDSRNKATHFIGVPAIVLAIMLALGWARVDIGGFGVSAALVVTLVLLAYYLMLDVPLGLAMAVVFGLMLWGADQLARAPLAVGVTWFLVLFVGGWALQLWGHVFEGRKPALVDNLFQIFVAPIFLAAELFFALGYKPGLHQSVQSRALQLRRAQSAESSISLERTSSRSGASGSRSA
jgi:uncharacterized membrane protein YGL010W